MLRTGNTFSKKMELMIKNNSSSLQFYCFRPQNQT